MAMTHRISSRRMICILHDTMVFPYSDIANDAYPAAKNTRSSSRTSGANQLLAYAHLVYQADYLDLYPAQQKSNLRVKLGCADGSHPSRV